MNIGNEIVKWIYVALVSSVMFLFFCLFLDFFCWIFLGWNPLIGAWPIFSGTISLVYYGHPVLVSILALGLTAMARIMLGNREPYIIALVREANAASDGTNVGE